jgi:cell wall-associated NlpC family hydrolase
MLAGWAMAGPALAADCSGAAIAPSLQTPGRSAAGVVTLGNRIVLIDDAGAVKQLLVCEIEGSGFVLKERIELPADIAVDKIEAEGSTITLKTADGQSIEKKIAAPPTGPAEAVPPEGYRFSASRKAEKKFVLKVAPSANPSARMAPGPAIEIELSPIVPGAQIYTRKILNIDPSRNAVTVFWDEIGAYGTRAFIATFVDGRMTAGAQIPLADIETIPENFTGVLADGRAYYLLTKEGKTVPVILELDAGFADKAKASGPLIEQFKRERAPDQPEKRGERIKQGIKKLAERALPSRAAPASGGDDEAAFQTLVRAATGDDPAPAARAAPPPQVKRADVAKCAVEYRDLQWVLTAGSFQKSGVANDCSPQARFWRRPHYLDGKSGQQVKGVPYCWGCSDSIATFLDHVKAERRLAGHSCTCRGGHWCLRRDVTGVDCSGFVSQCWKSGYYQTSRLGEISTTISKSDLKPGDALNLSNNHVLLFMDLVDTDTGPRFRVIEATNGQGSIGRVIESMYSATKVSGYKAIRYNRIVD